MSKQYFIGALVALSVIASETLEVRADVETAPQRSTNKAFKGYELYSWEDNGVWKFSLLPGTNRLKTEQEIRPVSPIVGSESLKRELALLAPNESVFWFNTEGKNLKFPPQDVVNALKQFATSLHIKLELPNR